MTIMRRVGMPFFVFMLLVFATLRPAVADVTSDCLGASDHKAVIDACTKALARGRKPELLLARGSAYVRRGDLLLAIRDFDAVLAASSAGDVRNKARLQRGDAQIGLGRTEAAIVDFDAALRDKSDDPELLARRAFAYERSGQWDRAIGDLSALIGQDEGFAKAYDLRAKVYMQKGVPDAALSDLNRALALDPRVADYYVDRAKVFQLKDDFSAAMKDMDRAVDLDRDNWAVRFMRAELRRANPRLEGAWSLYQALPDLDQVLEARPNFAPAYFSRAVVRVRTCDLALAIKDMDAAIDLDPSNATYLETRGVARGVQGDRDGAIADYRQALSLDPFNPRYYLLGAWAELKAGRAQDAFIDANRAVTLAPKSASGYVVRAHAQEELGRKDLALADFKTALDMAPSLADARQGIRRLDPAARLAAPASRYYSYVLLSPGDVERYLRAAQDMRKFFLQTPSLEISDGKEETAIRNGYASYADYDDIRSTISRSSSTGGPDPFFKTDETYIRNSPAMSQDQKAAQLAKLTASRAYVPANVALVRKYKAALDDADMSAYDTACGSKVPKTAEAGPDTSSSWFGYLSIFAVLAASGFAFVVVNRKRSATSVAGFAPDDDLLPARYDSPPRPVPTVAAKATSVPDDVVVAPVIHDSPAPHDATAETAKAAPSDPAGASPPEVAPADPPPAAVTDTAAQIEHAPLVEAPSATPERRADEAATHGASLAVTADSMRPVVQPMPIPEASPAPRSSSRRRMFGPVQAVENGFSNYAIFRGRAARSEFWFWFVFALIAPFAAGIVNVAISRDLPFVLFPMTLLLLILPSLALTIRRLHDTGRSGWWLFIMALPLVGVLIVFVFLCLGGTRGDNRFGADPLDR